MQLREMAIMQKEHHLRVIDTSAMPQNSCAAPISYAVWYHKCISIVTAVSNNLPVCN